VPTFHAAGPLQITASRVPSQRELDPVLFYLPSTAPRTLAVGQGHNTYKPLGTSLKKKTGKKKKGQTVLENRATNLSRTRGEKMTDYEDANEAQLDPELLYTKEYCIGE